MDQGPAAQRIEVPSQLVWTHRLQTKVIPTPMTNQSLEPTAGRSVELYGLYGRVADVCHARRHQRWLGSISLGVSEETSCPALHTVTTALPSIVPHLWIPEKIFTDCVKCPQFRRCGQYAMVLPLDSIADSIDRDVQIVARHA